MKKFKFRIAIIALFAFSIILIGNFVIYDFVDNSDSILLKIFFFIFMYFVFLIALYLIYRQVDKKYDDIETSKRFYYYNKPFILKANKNGNILIYNKTFEEKVYKYLNYKTVYDLNIENKDIDILETLIRQNPFTSIFESKTEGALFIRFLPIKVKNEFYLIGEDTTEQEKVQSFHSNMALYNQTTNLPNKNFLIMKLQELFANQRALRENNSLVSFDIVEFSNINNLFGYKISNETIKTIAKMAMDSLEKYNYQIFNTDLDNFFILFTNLHHYQEAIEWITKFSSMFNRAIEISGKMFTISIKAGIYHLEVDKYLNLTPEDAYEYAYLAHQKSKESRRFNYSVYDLALGKHFNRLQIMEEDLGSAISKNEFAMYLQPQLNNLTNKIIGFEALIRWNNPKYQFESPATYIAIAEKNNMIIDIGRFIINETFAIAKSLEQYDIRLSINISPIQLLQSGFVHEVTSAFQKYELKQEAICFEITETFLMEFLDDVIDKLRSLRRVGIGIYLDNFGVGYSSILYLKSLPISGISINKEFIRDLSSEQFSRNIVNILIKLAESLEVGISAEGIETEYQNQFLKDKGCNIVQGFFISKALPKEEAIQFMLEYNNKRNSIEY